MKKITVLAISVILYCSSTVTFLFAADMGEINKYIENIIVSGKSATIEATTKGITNGKGEIFVPYNTKAIVGKLEVNQGTLVSDKGLIKEVYGRKVIAYQFKESNFPVTLNQEYFVENFFKGKKAKLKYSHPDNVKKLSYTFVNTAPVEIGKYSISLSIPEGMELYQVVEPKRSKKKKKFEILEVDGLKTVKAKKGKLKPSDTFEMKLRVYKQPAAVKIALWMIAILWSGFLLYKRRDVFSSKS